VNIRVRAACSAYALALLVPVVAAAQGRPNPFADLFGRVPERAEGTLTAVDFRSSAGAQWADVREQPADVGDAVPPGLAGRADATLNYFHLGQRVQAEGHGRYGYQEYRQQPAFGAPAYDAGGKLVFKATNRIVVDAGGRFTSSPFFHLLDPAPVTFEQVAPTAGDPFIAYLIDNDTIEGDAGITADYTKRSSVTLSGQWRETRFTNRADDFSMRGWRGQWKRRMTRDLAVHLGYGRYEVGRPASDDDFMNELLDVGIEYARALPIARRTTLAFGTETSALRENRGRRQLRLNGSVELAHAFMRSWRASIGAYRSTEFVPAFAEPLLSERVRAGVSGYLSKRFIFYGNVLGSQSQIGLENSTSARFTTYSGDARLIFAMSKHLGVFGQYVRYYYELPPTANAIVALPKLSRQTYAIGIQTWVPLIQKVEVNRDPR
jgi:hypothetical protein